MSEIQRKLRKEVEVHIDTLERELEDASLHLKDVNVTADECVLARDNIDLANRELAVIDSLDDMG